MLGALTIGMLIWALAFPAYAVDLEPGKGISNLGVHLQYHSDPNASLASVLKRFQNDEFTSELDASMLDTNYAPEAWAAVEITNATLDDGRRPDPFIMTLSLALASALDVYIIRKSGFTESLLNHSAFDPFIPEDHSVTRIRTPVFSISPQEKVTLLVNFKFGPIQSFHMALETPAELEASAFQFGMTYTAFYAFCISCLVFFFGFHAAMKNWVGFCYALLFSVALIFIAYIDGLLFRFLYPEEPEWHSFVGFGLLFALSGVGFLTAGRSARRDGKETKLSIIITSLALFSAAGFVASLFSPGTYVAFAAYILLALMLASNFVASAEWKRRDASVQIGPLLIAGLSVITVVGVLTITVSGWANNTILVPDAAKSIFAVLLLATMLTLTTHMIGLRRNHAHAVEQQFASMQEEAERSKELLVAEKKYSRARELAGLRQRQLATASHDLKQPIASLRMTFDTIAENADPKLRERLREAFNYMESLSTEYLKDTTPDNTSETADDDYEAAEPVSSEQDVEKYSISIILETVQQMFHEEAISKGLKLRVVPCSTEVDIPPIILMRILSNLVSNAVKYTLQGRVLIGVRRAGDKIIVQVLDTGPGMSTKEITELKSAYKKGKNSQGQGLGLSVCFELAKEHAWPLDIASTKDEGTKFSLTIPAATNERYN